MTIMTPWKLERKVSLGNLLVIATVLVALATWYVRVDAHVKDEARHFDPIHISQGEIEEDLWYLRNRVDQIADYHRLPKIGVSSEQSPKQYEDGVLSARPALRAPR